jgi:uncharacterized membrane protein
VTPPLEDHKPGSHQTGPVIEFSTERLIFFSDAVVAIAITLLAFELPLPLPNATNSATNGQLLTSLHGKGTAYLAFLIGFVVIAGHWRSHHQLFRAVTRLDPLIIALNMTWLLLVVITPYATRVLAGNGAFAIRFTFYAAIQIATWLCFLLMIRQMGRLRLLPAETRSEPTGDSRVITVAALFLVSIPLSFVTHWAYLCWIAAPAAIRAEQLLRRWLRARDPAAA